MLIDLARKALESAGFPTEVMAGRLAFPRDENLIDKIA
jgi:hypothetical protein